MGATKGSKASWCWSSIIDGRVLKKDFIWDIGSGTSVRIWGDKWIPSIDLPTHKNYQDYYVKQGKVCELITDGEWNCAQ